MHSKNNREADAMGAALLDLAERPVPVSGFSLGKNSATPLIFKLFHDIVIHENRIENSSGQGEIPYRR